MGVKKDDSRIVLLNEGMYSYTLPPMPPEHEIWFHDLPKNQQYWKTPANKDFRWLNPDGTLKNPKKMPEREKIAYIEYWRDKWENGLWVMINGVPTYLNGYHVDHLIFNVFKSKFFMYLDAQRERFYFRELTDKDPICDGRLWVKCRRAGITSEQITHSIRVMISDFSNSIALQSDTKEKAVSTLLSKIIDTYIKRASWIREDFYSSNGKIPQASLKLTSAVVMAEGDYPLGGTARAFPSTSKALDGEEFMLLTMDELSKWLESDPYETFEVNKKTIVNPGKRGKMDLLSTTGDSKEVVKAVQAWHKLISGSNPLVRNPNGKTNTGLYEFFISGIHSMELVEQIPQVLDKFGKVNKEMAEEYIWNEVNQHQKNSKEYIYALYKMPMVKNHALLTVTSNTYFSKIRITAALDAFRKLSHNQKPYVVGALEEDPNTGNVFFESNIEREKRAEREGIDIPPGHWMIALHPYFSTEKNIDTRNRYKKNKWDGLLAPPVNPEFGMGYDPIRYKKEDTSSNSLSKASIIVYKKFDYFGSGEANKYAALYLHRPDDPKDAHRECAKACKYFGAPCMHERVIESVKEIFEDLGMLSFLQRNEKDGLYGMWIDAQGKVVKNALEEMQTEFSAPKKEDDIDQIEAMPFEECLMDMDSFDISNTTKFDTFMAMIELKYSLKQVLFTNLTDNSTRSMNDLINEIIVKRQPTR